MDLTLALAGLGVGVVVGLTGMGGGALMTPILVLVFGVPPVAAVSSDLAASAVMKPFGGAVHARRGTVNWALVRWLCVGSVPAAFLGVLLLRLLGDDETVQRAIRLALGVALLLAAGGLVLKSWAARRRGNHDGPPEPIVVRPLPTALLGAAGGLVVGLTSVGSGSLIIVALLAMYPKLRANDLVGTDLVQAIPLVSAAALGHALFGDLQLDLAGAVLLGSIPGVLIGSRISSRAPAGLVRTALVVVLLASALKLFDLPTAMVGLASGIAVLMAIIPVLLRRHAQDSPGVPASEGQLVTSVRTQRSSAPGR
ncbi:sulfite exporter TauE/SafE family protein [Actinoplanes sp. NPDC048988]|uniref:sulfite exporter TauE/SafE family protein n=1 Tax=Actinoplanes sp. NPDC048988 TaxID=3363901 RepID=UPI00371B8138